MIEVQTWPSGVGCEIEELSHADKRKSPCERAENLINLHSGGEFMADVRYGFCTQCYGTGSRLNGAMCDACKGAGRVPVADGLEEEEDEESQNSRNPI